MKGLITASHFGCCAARSRNSTRASTHPSEAPRSISGHLRPQHIAQYAACSRRPSADASGSSAVHPFRFNSSATPADLIVLVAQFFAEVSKVRTDPFAWFPWCAERFASLARKLRGQDPQRLQRLSTRQTPAQRHSHNWPFNALEKSFHRASRIDSRSQLTVERTRLPG